MVLVNVLVSRANSLPVELDIVELLASVFRALLTLPPRRRVAARPLLLYLLAAVRLGGVGARELVADRRVS